MATDDTPTVDLDAALEVRFDSDAGDNLTVREWLCSLLTTVWIKQEGFSGKRPWGNSGWHCDVFTALIKAGFMEGRIDDEGYLEDWDDDAGETLVLALIHHMCGVQA